jgi:hypothetical protein
MSQFGSLQQTDLRVMLFLICTRLTGDRNLFAGKVEFLIPRFFALIAMAMHALVRLTAMGKACF